MKNFPAVRGVAARPACMYVCMYVNVCMLMFVYFNEWSSNRVLIRLWLYVFINVCMYVGMVCIM